MKLDKYEVKNGLFGFVILCILFFVGVILAINIKDVFIKTVEVEAVVTGTWETHHNVHTHTPGGPHMNIEWVDLNGEVCSDGNITNEDNLSEGDTYTISVDAKTQSRRVPSKIGCIVLFVIGVILCIGSFKLMKVFYGRTEY